MPQAKWPTAGDITVTPRSCSLAMFSWVAAFKYMPVFIAGQTMMGACAAKSVVLSKSSARPQAIFAKILAVAGATTKASAQLAKAICSTLNSWLPLHMLVATALPLISLKVSGVTNCCACSVITTRTSQPCLRKRLTRSTAL